MSMMKDLGTVNVMSVPLSGNSPLPYLDIGTADLCPSPNPAARVHTRTQTMVRAGKPWLLNTPER